MKTATKIRTLDTFKGDAALYRLSEPMDDYDGKPHDYVIVSATNVLWSGDETYIFPANEAGEVVDWGELPGSFRGDLDHERALRDAGYEIAPEQH